MAGMAIRADSQCIRSRVVWPMSPPNQTETENSMMLPVANPVTAMARSKAFSWRSVSRPRAAGS